MSDDRQWIFYAADPLPPSGGKPKDLLGGKGASLHAMIQSSLPVPPAFVITPECCRHFFEHGEAWPTGLEEQVREHLARLEQETGRAYGKGASPLLVSIRSGAAVSMPGMMDTILNCGLHPGLAETVGDTPAFWRLYLQFVLRFAKTVAGVTGEELGVARADVDSAGREFVARCLDRYQERIGVPFPQDPWSLLVACVNAVFRSWGSERAMAYRKHNDIRGLHGTAVVIQAMFPSRVAGVLFTEDPTACLTGRMIIEASYGLGESIVSGDVTPDKFVVNRQDFTEVRTTVGNKVGAVLALGDPGIHDPRVPCLSAVQIEELCRVALRVEEHFQAPMDIEWGFADGRLALLQCRPIRGLEVLQDIEAGRQEEIARLGALTQGKRRVWAVHNLGETLRFPTPLTWDVMRHFMSGKGGFGGLYRDFGYRPSREVDESGFLELICGRIYADPDRLAGLFWDGLPLRYELDKVFRNPKELDRAPSLFVAEELEGDFLIRLPGLVRAMMRSGRRLRQVRQTARETFEERILPDYLAYVREAGERDLTALSTRELIAEFHARNRRVLDEFGKESLKPGFLGGLALDSLHDLLSQLLGKDEGVRMASVLTMGLEGDITLEQDALLVRVAQGNATMDEFIDHFGHRTINEMELSEPRWREDRSYPERLVAQMRKGGRTPAELHAESARKRTAAETELPAVLERWGGASFREEIAEWLAEARRLLPYRENGKYYLMMGYELLRMAALELSRRWGIGNDVFFLHLSELDQFEDSREQLTESIRKRRTRWQSAQRLEVADRIDSMDLSGLGKPREAAGATGDLKGEALAPGIVTAPARIVFDPREGGEIPDGCILVCPSTDPAWTPLFLNARGLVVERGGALSHGAIVARDFGIPAVACPDATRRIPDGATIRLDGNAGLITLAKDPNHAATSK